MPKRLFCEALVLAALFLGSCNDRVWRDASEAYDLADAAHANARTALERADELESKVNDLERKLDDLDSREDRLTEATIDDVRAIKDELAQLAETYNRHTH